jgi:hypothetical protein
METWAMASASDMLQEALYAVLSDGERERHAAAGVVRHGTLAATPG